MAAPTPQLRPPGDVLEAYGFADAQAVPITIGHINATFRLTGPRGTHVLQRLSAIFGAEVNLDIAALTPRLQDAGLVTPHLVRTRAGEAWQQDADGAVWRALTFVPGEVFVHVMEAGQCFGAGELLGQFHRALAAVDHKFCNQRLGVHDTPAHLAGLRAALADHGQHAAYAQVAPMAAEVFRAIDALPKLGGLPERIVHGDPKLSNVIFVEAHARPQGGMTAEAGASGRPWPARAMVDLDTMAHMQVHLELGDALRSWCNPAGEGPAPASFSLAYLQAALAGYARGARGLLQPDEVAAIVPGIATVALELTARFLRDALEERYFGWDARRYQHAWQHHLVRAKSQLAGYRALRAHGAAAADAVARAFGLTA